MAGSEWKVRLARPIARLERRLERFWSQGQVREGAPVIDPYLGYATPEGLIARGRVLTELRRTTPEDNKGAFDNLREMAGLFLTDEVADVTVRAPDHGVEAVSDEEGYFTLVITDHAPAPGWHEIRVEAEGAEAFLPVRVSDPAAPWGVISDVDDTVIRTGAWSLWQNLRTTFSGNLSTREVFEDGVKLLDRMVKRGAPVFYVSSSPWNLHSFLTRLFEQAGVPRGPLFLRDYGVSETQLITGTHGDHKGAAIDAILGAHPGLPFILIGDTGQHDAHVYRDAAKRHPGRIAHVILRRAGREAEAQAVADLRNMGVSVDVVVNYGAVSWDPDRL